MTDQDFDIPRKRIWVAGHNGLVGSALVRRLEQEGCRVLTCERRDVDLTSQAAVRTWLANNRPDAIIVAAAKVGGILANATQPVDFLYDNLMISSNIINAAHETDVAKLMFLGSSCIYPKLAPQPLAEEALLTGPLEPTNEWYAVAKISGIKLCQAYRQQYGRDFISVTPANLYGPGDNFDPESSHVIPALLLKTHHAKVTGAETIGLWGTGVAIREFMHVDDAADALVFLLRRHSDKEHINVGTGEKISIMELATIITEVVGFKGRLEFDASKPDGMPEKTLDTRRLQALGWTGTRSLKEGISHTYDWYRKILA